MAHSNEAATLASISITINLIKVLHEKGLFTDDDYKNVLQKSIDGLQVNPDGQDAIAVIQEIAKL